MHDHDLFAQYDDVERSCPGLAQYTNTDQTHVGDPHGVHEGTGGSGSARPADARRALNEGGMTVAGYRPAVTHLTGGSCVDGRTPRVACDRPILVMSLLSNATGHLTKLSARPVGTAAVAVAIKREDHRLVRVFVWENRWRSRRPLALRRG